MVTSQLPALSLFTATLCSMSMASRQRAERRRECQPALVVGHTQSVKVVNRDHLDQMVTNPFSEKLHSLYTYYPKIIKVH